MSLWGDFIANTFGRPAFKPTQYFTAYERHLARFCGRSVTMIEIGVYFGGSLQMWKKFLGPNAQIVGIDINPDCRTVEEPQIAVRIGDQSDSAFLQRIVDEFGPIDIVLDDGSHEPGDIAASFAVLYPQLDRNGVYIVEDILPARPEGEAGLRPEGSFIETVKDRVDELQAAGLPEDLRWRETTAFAELTLSVHVYEGLVVFERGRHVDKRALATTPDKHRFDGLSPSPDTGRR
jgi:hypothetical protein